MQTYIHVLLNCSKKEASTLQLNIPCCGFFKQRSSGDPFPEPIRVSVGFTVTGLSGNMCTHICPPRRTFHDIARRHAYICLDVIQAGSSA